MKPASANALSCQATIVSYSSPAHPCPRCAGSALRVPRRLLDLLLSMFVSVSRYRCCSAACGWEGNVRATRYPLLLGGG